MLWKVEMNSPVEGVAALSEAVTPLPTRRGLVCLTIIMASAVVIVLALTGATAGAIMGVLGTIGALVVVVALADDDAFGLRRASLWVRHRFGRLPKTRS